MEIQGTLVVSVVMVVTASFLTEAVKKILPEHLHRYIPLPLAIVLIGIGVLLAYLQSEDMVAGGIQGLMVAALAALGYDAISGLISGRGDGERGGV